jgi:hypothetical protein
MKTIVNQILIISIFVFTISSCKDEKDKTAPVIKSVSEPLQNDTLFTGDELHVDASITDNEELSQLKIDIHSADDGHTHGKTDASAFWETVRIVTLSGTSSSIHEDIAIPGDAAAGKYHVILTAVDKAGNQSEFVERDIHIRNSTDLIAPEIVISSPVENATLSTGSPLTVSGTLTDNVALRKVEIKVYRGTTLVSDTDVDLANATHDLNESISSNGWIPGSFSLTVKVYDHVMNHTEKTVSFTLN